MWLIISFTVVAAVIVLVILSYVFRSSFILFEGIRIMFDAIGEALCAFGNAVGDIDIGDD